MSVHNGGCWLRGAIECVLTQSWRDFEFLILDDASTDDSAAQIEAAGDARIRFIRLHENISLTRCLNVGLREAKGELIARQDADDVSAPDRLERQVAFLDAHPEIALVGSQARLIDGEGRSRGTRDLPLDWIGIRWLSLLDNPIVHSAAMFRTAMVRDECGGYDETFPCCQDYDLWTRTLERFPVANLPQRLVSCREHGGSISATRQVEAREMVRRVVRRVVQTWLPEIGNLEETVELLCAFRRHLTPAEVEPFGQLLERVETAFSQRFPDAVTNRDLVRTRAGVRARIGYNLLTQDRALAARMLRRALRTWPPIVATIPWLRVAALAALGPRARTVFERLRA